MSGQSLKIEEPEAGNVAQLRREDLAYAMPGAWANYASEGQWQYARHLSLIEDKLLDVAAGRIKRLVINMPPQNGKSQFVSQYFTSWYLGRNPNKRVILTSYEADFAASWGRRSRDALEQYGEVVFGEKVSQASAAASLWSLQGSRDGYMATAGAGGPITGKGADLIIIDDPIKNQQEALSAAHNAKLVEWYRSTVINRLSPDGAIIVIMTRWAYDDLTGWLLREGAKVATAGRRWHTVVLPAVAVAEGECDPLGRVAGEALWPERYSLEWLQEQRAWVGSYWWNSQYQQNPAPRGGDMVQMSWFRRYRVAPERRNASMVVLSLDTAQKGAEVNAYTVIGVWLIYNEHYYLVDVIRDRYTHPRLLQITKNLISTWRPHVVLVEDKGSGISLAQHLEDDGKPVKRVEPTVDKVIRFSNESPAIEAGNVYLPEEGTAPWLFEYEQEVQSFPNSIFMDQIDMTSQFLAWARERSSGVEMF